VIGAPGNDVSTQTGSAIFYYGSNAPPYLVNPTTVFAASCFNSLQAHTRFGFAVATAGDIDADGLDDAVVGAPGLAIDGNRSGYVCVLRGQAGTGISPAARYVITAQTNADLIQSFAFGASVSTAGDVDGDGITDLLVGAPAAHSASVGGGIAAVGAAYVFRGQAGTAPAVPALSIMTGDAVSDGADLLFFGNFGHSVANAGDLNGDGFADVIVGSPEDDSAGNNAGGASSSTARARGSPFPRPTATRRTSSPRFPRSTASSARARTLCWAAPSPPRAT
jgi:hypothetical protein